MSAKAGDAATFWAIVWVPTGAPSCTVTMITSASPLAVLPSFRSAITLFTAGTKGFTVMPVRPAGDTRLARSWVTPPTMPMRRPFFSTTS